MKARALQRRTSQAASARPQNALKPPRPFATPQPSQQKGNRTGLPDRLKASVERLSGFSLDDVRVHRNSPAPARVQALAYTRGTDIHIRPGQDKHLAHEAWHVVQQKQGRVRATTQLRGLGFNDDSALEREADLMGKHALKTQPESIEAAPIPRATPNTLRASAHDAAPIQAMKTIIRAGKTVEVEDDYELKEGESLAPKKEKEEANERTPLLSSSVKSSSPSREPIGISQEEDEIRPMKRSVEPEPSPQRNRDVRQKYLQSLGIRPKPLVQSVHLQQQDEEEALPRRPQPVTGQHAFDFLTANTPGPITGASGGLNAVSSVFNPPTDKVPQGFANSSYVNKLQSASKPLSGVSAGTNIITGGADLLSIGAEARDMHKKGGWSRFWSGLKANIRNPFKKPKDADAKAAEGRSATKRLLVNTATNTADVGLNQVPSAWSSIANVTGQTAPHVLGPLASGASMGISSVVAGRSLWRGGRAAMHGSRVNKLLKNDELQNPAMKEAAEHHRAQMKKRTTRSMIGAGGAVLGAVGGGLLLGGLLGASMLTPIGWGLAAAGGLVAAGLGIRKLWRWHQKRKAGQLGVERDKHAKAIHEAINNPLHPGHADAKKLLKARGISKKQVMGDEGVDFLKRKAESW